MLRNIEDRDEGKRLVLLYARGSFHFPLIEPLVRENLDIEFYLHSNLFGNSTVAASGLLSYRNFHFVASLDELKFKLNQFGAFITTDAEPANPHSYSLRLIEFFHAIKVPVLELQHGLFQLGLHYYDVPSGCSFGGDSLPAQSQADAVLTYYPPSHAKSRCEMIGYPPFDGRKKPFAGSDWLLVLSNLHWLTYTHEERRTFYEGVYRLAAERQKPVVWKQHHGEIGNKHCGELRAELASKYPEAVKWLRFHHEDEALKGVGLSELISRASQVVSTVSTVLLDCEMQEKGVALFSAPSVACLVDRIREKDTFSTQDELFALCDRGARPLATGCLHAYDNATFRRVLGSLYAETTLSCDEFLEALFTYVQPLNSELRWNIVTMRDAWDRRWTEMRAFSIASKAQSDETLEAVRGFRSELSETANRVLSDLSAHHSEWSDLLTRSEERERTIVDSEVRLATVSGELKASENLVSELRGQIETRTADLARETNRADELARQMETLAAERDTLCKAVADERGRAELAESRVEALNLQCASIDASLATVKAQNEKLVAQCQTLKEAVAERDRRTERVTDELLELRDQFADKEEECSNAAGLLEETRGTLAELERRAAAEERRADVTEVRLANALEMENTLKKQVGDREGLIRTIRTEKANLIAERDELRVEKTDRVQRVEGLKSELATLKKIHEEDRTRLDKQQALLSGMDRRVKALSDLVIQEHNRRLLSNRIKRFAKGCLPYGAVCAWRRMVYGCVENAVPLGHSSIGSRFCRAFKNLLPYGLVRTAGR